MSAAEIDDYLATVDDPAKRAALEHLRTQILAVVPDAEQCISYSMPAFRVDGKVVAGFAAFKKHLSYFPHSGAVIGEVPAAKRWGTTKGTLQFTPDDPLPDDVVADLIAAKQAVNAAKG